MTIKAQTPTESLDGLPTALYKALCDLSRAVPDGIEAIEVVTGAKTRKDIERLHAAHGGHVWEPEGRDGLTVSWGDESWVRFSVSWSERWTQKAAA